jgi:hypothetical protein
MTTTNMNNTPLEAISFQFALFFRDIVLRPDLEFKDLNEQMQNLFDGIPTIMDIPAEAPSDIPILNLKSENGVYTCQIARSRIDIFLNRVDKEKSNQELLNDFNIKAQPFVGYVLSKRNIARFGMVAKYFYRSADSVDVIKRKYFKNELGIVSELSIRFNRQDDVDGILINDVVDVGAKIARIGDANVKGILVSRDINNFPTDKGLTINSLKKISKRFSAHLSEAEIEGLIK